MHTRAVVVLGCQIRVRPRAQGVELVGAAGRRARAAAAASRGFTGSGEATRSVTPEGVSVQSETVMVVASGGRTWDGRVEADALADELVRLGVSSDTIVRERASRNTRENARRTAELLRHRSVRHVVLVTCVWHMPRAAALFRREGLEVEPFSASSGDATLSERAYRVVREVVAARLDRAMLAWERS